MDSKETITTLVTTISTALEKKKMEFTNMRGAIEGVRELQKSHTTFLENSKADLKKLVSEGKLSQDVASFVSTWLGKSSKVIEDFSAAVKTNHDSKSGELISLTNVLQLLKKSEEESTAAPVLPVASSSPAPTPSDEVKVEKRSYKSRLKKNDVTAKTVERLKKMRAKSLKSDDKDQ